MRELKFCGAMINGHTNGQYLDHPSLYPFWERARGAGRADLHSSRRSGRALAGAGGPHRVCAAPPGNGTFETGSHALRLIFGGVFDRFPRAQARSRTSGRDAALPALALRQPRQSSMAIKLAKPPSQYIKENIVVTTSGMCSAEPLNCAIAALGHERVMFAADYPFEVDGGSRRISSTACRCEEQVRSDICFNNAAKLLKLPG